MLSAKVKGMQKAAIIKSDAARLIRKSLRSVLERRPFTKTSTTKILPPKDRKVVMAYRNINPIKASVDNLSSSYDGIVEGNELVPESLHNFDIFKVPFKQVKLMKLFAVKFSPFVDSIFLCRN